MDHILIYRNEMSCAVFNVTLILKSLNRGSEFTSHEVYLAC